MENENMTESEDSSKQFEDADDLLSLCNLQIDGYDCESVSRRPSTSSDQDLFEFFVGFSPKSIQNDSAFENSVDSDEANEYRKRDYLSLRTASFNKARNYRFDGLMSENRSRSVRYRNYSPVQKVNITAITSMSAKSRRRMFMFGPLKFKPEMDVNAIRKRRSRLAPPQIPPVPVGNEMVASGGKGQSIGGGGLVRPLWCRSHIATALAKSFGCIPASMV